MEDSINDSIKQSKNKYKPCLYNGLFNPSAIGSFEALKEKSGWCLCGTNQHGYYVVHYYTTKQIKFLLNHPYPLWEDVD